MELYVLDDEVKAIIKCRQFSTQFKQRCLCIFSLKTCQRYSGSLLTLALFKQIKLIEVKLSTQLSVSILNQSVWFSGGSTCSSTTTHCVALVQTLVNRKEQGAKPTEAIYNGK